MEYKIVEGPEEYMGDFLEEVNEHIRLGWKPQGGLAVRSGSSSGANLLQAMIKEKTVKNMNFGPR